MAAWAASNLTRLAQLTTPQVDEQFLEIPGKLKTDWIYVRCDGAAGSNYCTLRNSDGDQVLLRVLSQYLGAAHAVVQLTASLTVYPANGEQYAREFVLENRAGAPMLLAQRRNLAAHSIEQVGEKLRAMMPWIKKNKLVDQAKN